MMALPVPAKTVFILRQDPERVQYWLHQIRFSEATFHSHAYSDINLLIAMYHWINIYVKINNFLA